MINYALVNKSGVSYALTGQAVSFIKSLTLSAGKLSAEKTTVDKSYGDGALLIGSSRYKTRELTITAEVAFTDDSSARSYLNDLTKELVRSVTLIDETNAISASVSFDSFKLSWKDGCLLRHGTWTAVLEQLDPFWHRESSPSSFQIDAGVPYFLNVVNSGATNAAFRLTLTVAQRDEAISNVELSTTDSSLIVNSAVFGLVNRTELLIDTEHGLVSTSAIGSPSSVSELDKIEDGTGFFTLSVGSTSLMISIPVAATAVFTLIERYVL